MALVYLVPRMDGWMDGWVDGRLDGCAQGWGMLMSRVATQKNNAASFCVSCKLVHSAYT